MVLEQKLMKHILRQTQLAKAKFEIHVIFFTVKL